MPSRTLEERREICASSPMQGDPNACWGPRSQPHPRALRQTALPLPRILSFLPHSQGRIPAEPARLCAPLTRRSMTARSARCQARSSVSWSDCSRNS